MGSTTAHGLPYPVGTDRVMDGDNAIQALAEALDLWVWNATLTLTAGPNFTLGTSKAFRRGRLVVISFQNLTCTVASLGGGIFATLPAEGRPPENVRGVILNNTTAVPTLCEAFPNGNIQHSPNIAVGNQLYGSFVIPVA